MNMNQFVDRKMRLCNLNPAKRKSNNLPWSSDTYSGIGGESYFETGTTREHTPIVFVHGNTRSASDWRSHFQYLIDKGFSGDALWAITFDNPTSTHTEMRHQLETFVSKILRYTQSDSISIVAHSLGVTGARYWMYSNDRFDSVDTFIGIAGANHGLTVCKYICYLRADKGIAQPSMFLRSDYNKIQRHPLSLINQNETRGDVTYYTIRGTDDQVFNSDPRSPILDGATNISLSEDHNGVKDSTVSMDHICSWCSS